MLALRANFLKQPEPINCQVSPALERSPDALLPTGRVGMALALIGNLSGVPACSGSSMQLPIGRSAGVVRGVVEFMTTNDLKGEMSVGVRSFKPHDGFRVQGPVYLVSQVWLNSCNSW